MATINPVPVQTGIPGTTTILWETLTEADTAAAHAPGGYEPAIGNVQAIGTLGGATVALQGSNNGTNWVAVRDLDGADIALTSSAPSAEFSSAMLYFRPSASGGSSQDIDLYLNFRG